MASDTDKVRKLYEQNKDNPFKIFMGAMSYAPNLKKLLEEILSKNQWRLEELVELFDTCRNEKAELEAMIEAFALWEKENAGKIALWKKGEDAMESFTWELAKESCKIIKELLTFVSDAITSLSDMLVKRA